MQELHISVRTLVEFIFREGDIDNRSGKLANTEAMMEGSRIHRKIQKSMDASYRAEVPLKLELELTYLLVIEGRADGIAFGEFIPDEESAPYSGTEQTMDHIREKNNTVNKKIWYIDEIKGIYRNVAAMETPYYVHKAQALCYAYIYALQNHLEEIGIQMTYCNLDTEELRYFREIYTWEQLRNWFENLLAEYRKWADWQMLWKKRRQVSIKSLEFPFPYREGQKKLVSDVYRTIMRKKTLFLEAPTGVGKTISTIFPAVKAVGEGLADRIFYLTAKTITATVAKETFLLLEKEGYEAKVIQLTAKEKLCLCEEMDCNPVHCPYAKGHFDRVNAAVFDLLQKKNLLTREEILKQAEEYQVCPFELSLDTASFADDIICDYNYVFDPNVYLKRFFQEGVKGDYIFLVDEAHNLVDRSREMYSESLYKEDVLAVKRILKPHSSKICRTLDKCNRAMLEMKRECESCRELESVGTLTFHLMRLASQMDEFLEKPRDFPEKKTVMDFYFTLRNFLTIYDMVDDHYVIYSRIAEDGRFFIKLFCVDPSANLQKCIDRSNSTIFFSATLLPVSYYKRLLSTKEDNYAVYAKSTFQENQRLLALGRDVSTKYTRRNEQEYRKIADYIAAVTGAKEGNYMIFFPSYKLMQDVYDIFLEQAGDDCMLLLQHSNMKEAQREEFLKAFDRKQEGTLIAFCVMGGIFSEGIDLKKDSLIGAVIVGTGLPQVSEERNILKNYYDRQGLSGFDYAFRYPGMNKVLQAAGRVIRTDEDRGVILLLDERFLAGDYLPLFPREWENRKIVSLPELKEELSKFWSKENDRVLATEEKTLYNS
ncbi:MAG: ATP-dependent DNA helicase [Lachnospiraceae bacterium]|nr:ATP-dependent DNA helicase [Agathobacter sp.]MDD6445390.1 ATP-dependent DNA helicase [Lachnospiraceae bacterium]MDY4894079.1 ATP-dependent DNA helicase [Agathobacter sp.]